jgi:dTDP-4-amino-4,6-dideoxygalactose transaminase
MLVNHGRWNAKYEHEIEGFNMRLDTIQAAVLRIKLQHTDEWTALRKEKAKLYIQELSQISTIKVPQIRRGADPVWHIFSILSENRDEIIQNFKANEVEYGIHYPIPLHLQKAYNYKGYKKGDFPVTEKVAQNQLSLPFWPEIGIDKILYIIDILSKLEL